MEAAKGPRRGAARFEAYLDEIAAVLGHASRVAAARAYCTGLLLPGARKSVEPMAARIEPGRVQARHQSLHHVVAKAEWDDAAALARSAARSCPPSSGTGRCGTGSSTTPASRSRASTPSA
jgi:SRSO17 transposase